jgi:hypothetical protein
VGKAGVLPDNLLVNAGLFAGGVMLRNAPDERDVRGPAGLLVWSPLQAITTAVAGTVVLLLFRNWFAIRIEV